MPTNKTSLNKAINLKLNTENIDYFDDFNFIEVVRDTFSDIKLDSKYSILKFLNTERILLAIKNFKRVNGIKGKINLEETRGGKKVPVEKTKKIINKEKRKKIKVEKRQKEILKILEQQKLEKKLKVEKELKLKAEKEKNIKIESQKKNFNSITGRIIDEIKNTDYDDSYFELDNVIYTAEYPEFRQIKLFIKPHKQIKLSNSKLKKILETEKILDGINGYDDYAWNKLPENIKNFYIEKYNYIDKQGNKVFNSNKYFKFIEKIEEKTNKLLSEIIENKQDVKYDKNIFTYKFNVEDKLSELKNNLSDELKLPKKKQDKNFIKKIEQEIKEYKGEPKYKLKSVTYEGKRHGMEKNDFGTFPVQLGSTSGKVTQLEGSQIGTIIASYYQNKAGAFNKFKGEFVKIPNEYKIKSNKILRNSKNEQISIKIKDVEYGAINFLVENSCALLSLNFLVGPEITKKYGIKKGITPIANLKTICNDYNISIIDSQGNKIQSRTEIKNDNREEQLILLKNEHLLPLFKLNKIEEPTKEEKEIPKFENLCFFDFETIHKDGIIMPLSVSFCNVDIRFGKFIKGDIMFYFGANCCEKFILNLPKNTCIIGFNNNNFDDYLIVNEILNNTKFKNNKKFISYQNNRVINLIYSDKILRSFDIIRFLAGKNLADLCTAFNISKENCKGSIDFKLIQKLFDEGGFKNVYEQLGEKLNEYNKHDITSIIEIYEKFDRECIKTLLEKCGEEYSPNYCLNRSIFTVGSLAKKLCVKLCGNYPTLSKSYSEFKMLRESLFGGRSQNFKQGKFENICSMDVCSLYPTIMKSHSHYLLIEKDEKFSEKACRNVYPVGYPKKLENINENSILNEKFIKNGKLHPALIYKLGMVKCVINQKNLKIKVVPKKNEEEMKLDWNCDETFTRFITSIDYYFLKILGCEVKILEYYYWEEYNYYFDNYISLLFKLKQEQDEFKAQKSEKYNDAQREFYKIMMNSIYGKSIENIHLSGTFLNYKNKEIDNEKYCNINMIDAYDSVKLVSATIKDAYIEKNWKKLNTKHSLTGVFVLAYSHAFMFPFLHWFKDDVIQTDTDSIHVPISCMNQILKQLPAFKAGNEMPSLKLNGKFKKLGQFENEIKEEVNKTIHLKSKCYLFILKNSIKKRFKGINFKNGLYKIDINNKDENWKPLRDEKETINFYEAYFKNKVIYYKISQITRKTFIELNNGNSAYSQLLALDNIKKLTL